MNNEIIELDKFNEKKQDDVIEKRLHQLNALYEMLERLHAKGWVANAWGGCEDDFSDPDGSVLSDFMEYVSVYYKHLDVTDWMESFYQVLCWQYQSMHEGVTTYYENFYGGSEYPLIVQTAAFLQRNGYMDIYKQYNKGIVFCKEYEHPQNEKVNANELDTWINWHTKEVWDFCVDILLKHRDEWRWKA